MCKAILALLLLCSVTYAQSDQKRYELGGMFTYTFLKEIGTRDAGVGTEAAGLGGRLVYRALPYVDLETDVIVLPGNAATSGTRLQVLLGVKTGRRFEKLGLFAKARPGFIHFRKDPFGVADRGSGPTFFRPNWASSTEPSVEFGGVMEYYTARGAIVRFDIGDNIVHYESRTVQVSDFLPPMQAGGFTTHNLQWTLGLGLRF